MSFYPYTDNAINTLLVRELVHRRYHTANGDFRCFNRSGILKTKNSRYGIFYFGKLMIIVSAFVEQIIGELWLIG